MPKGRINVKTKQLLGQKRLAKIRGQVGRSAAVTAMRLASGMAIGGGGRSGRNIRTAGFLGMEKKFYDTALVATAIASPTDSSGAEMDPSATSMISTPVQGTSEQNRDGKKIIIKSVQIDGRVNLPSLINQTAVPAPFDVYVALVLDTQSNGAQMNSEDCFKNTSAAAALAAKPQRNLLFANRFRVIAKKQFILKHPTATYDGTNIEIGGDTREFHWFKKMNLPVLFNAGTTASIANVIDNSLHLIAFASASNPTLAYNARIRFVG